MLFLLLCVWCVFLLCFDNQDLMLCLVGNLIKADLSIGDFYICLFVYSSGLLTVILTSFGFSSSKKRNCMFPTWLKDFYLCNLLLCKSSIESVSSESMTVLALFSLNLCQGVSSLRMSWTNLPILLIMCLFRSALPLMKFWKFVSYFITSS